MNIKSLQSPEKKNEAGRLDSEKIFAGSNLQ